MVTAAQRDHARMKLLVAHLRIARLDHWSKNVFVLPGIAVAVSIDPALLAHLAVLPIVVGLIGIGLGASSNYVLHHLLAPPFYKIHPPPSNPPCPSGPSTLPWPWASRLFPFS